MMLSIFFCAYLPFIYLFWWNVYSEFSPIFKFFFMECVTVLMSEKYKPYIKIHDLQTFSLSLWLIFSFLSMDPCKDQTFLIWLSIISFFLAWIVFLFSNLINHSLTQSHEGFLCYFWRHCCSTVMFRSVIQFELTFVDNMR